MPKKGSRDYTAAVWFALKNAEVRIKWDNDENYNYVQISEKNVRFTIKIKKDLAEFLTEQLAPEYIKILLKQYKSRTKK